jgi:hypothetical protein
MKHSGKEVPQGPMKHPFHLWVKIEVLFLYWSPWAWI